MQSFGTPHSQGAGAMVGHWTERGTDTGCSRWAELPVRCAVGPQGCHVKQFLFKVLSKYDMKRGLLQGFQAAVEFLRSSSFRAVGFSTLPTSIEKRGLSLRGFSVRKHLSGLLFSWAFVFEFKNLFFFGRCSPFFSSFLWPSSVPVPL